MKYAYNRCLILQTLPTIFLAFYVIFLVFTFHVITDARSLRHNPADDITIACGSSGNISALDGRRWYGDRNSILFPSHGVNKVSVSLAPDEPAVEANSVPYKTARLSHSEFTYVIPVSTPGPKFVRFHFYSSAYEGFDPSQAAFYVEVNNILLLSCFNVSLTADVLGRKVIVKEFHVPVMKSSIVSITFTPSDLNAFAFVNGIEVVRTPKGLFFWHPDDPGPTLIGQQRKYHLRNDTILESVYRINIGGRQVPPAEDTNGLFRSWEDMDTEYLTVPSTSTVLSADAGMNLNFTTIPSYIAPAEVYQTSRSMGTDKEKNKGNNLTWEFPVNCDLNYMVRLHFCEIVRVVNSSGDRVFRIFMANQIAEERADVIYWSGGKYVPYFKDYIVAVSGNVEYEGKVNLSITLQANPKDWRTSYADAILNGVEIFKLHGEIPSPNTYFLKAIVGILSVITSCTLIVPILGFLNILFKRWKAKDSAFITKSTKTKSSCFSSEQCRCFSLAEIKSATNNFSDASLIGVGGFGHVYTGRVNGGANSVAIKRLKAESTQGAHEFKTEIHMLSHLHHLNLVSLIGYCDENHEMILVYEYMPHGTLSSHLYNTRNPSLSWKQRLEICIGAANGLQYLHSGAKHTVIHRDVKTTNILLDEKWVAKISDFGLSKVRPSNMSKAHISTMVKGSIGYLDPEYYRLSRLTEKSDVYSFGVVLCEVLCGRPPVLPTVEMRQMSLAEWARSCYHEGTLDQIVDPCLTGKIAPECLKKFCEIAVSCMHDSGAERPSMKDVVRGLESAMQLQHNSEGINPRIHGEIGPVMNRDGTSRCYCSWGDTSGVVFSEINELQGRF